MANRRVRRAVHGWIEVELLTKCALLLEGMQTPGETAFPRLFARVHSHVLVKRLLR